MLSLENLNRNCPFGHRSTNFYSKRGEAPDLKEAQTAGKLINKTLMAFVRFLDQLSKTREPIASVEVYNGWAAKSCQISETNPKCFAEIFPIRLARSAEIVLDEIKASKLRVMDTILRLHEEMLREEESHMKAARKVMALLRDSYLRVFCDDAFVAILGLELEDDGGVTISEDLWRNAVSYQDLQERCDSVEEVRGINRLIESRPEIVSEILGIQAKLCDMVNLFLQENKEFTQASIAFSEVALWSDTGEMTPSSRFLKIILHNWGVYFLERANSPVDVMFRHAMCRALEDEIYQQNIFVFRCFPKGVRLYGVIPKVCPARLAIGKVMLHFLSE